MNQLLNRIDARLLVVISRALMALSTPVVAFLVLQAGALSGGAVHPISFCNVLFVGNLAAAFVVLGSFGPNNIYNGLRKLDGANLLLVFLTGCLASVQSSLIFLALETTSVTNAILLSRMGPITYALLAFVVLNSPIRKWEWAGFGFITVGVIAVVLQTSELMLNKGDYMILASAIFYALTSLVAKRALKSVDLGTAVFARNFVSAGVFFFIAIYLFGPNHFADAFEGQLWMIMTIYAVVIVLGSQFTWYSAITRLEPTQVTKWTVMTPAFGVLFAYLINDEVPSIVDLSALALITVGIVISNIGSTPPPRRPRASSDTPETSLAGA